jgi:thiamine-phosphate pyrophosphorylase
MEARQILGPERLIGVSTHNLDQVRQAIRDGASYLGVGPTFPGGTKEFTEFPGLDFVSRVIEHTSLPAFVIGGVCQENIDKITADGGHRIAVEQGVCLSPDHGRAAEELLRAVQ